jgi:amidase
MRHLKESVNGRFCFSVDLGGVTISRSVFVNRQANWTRWLDSFTNTTNAPLMIKVAFGGQSGTGASGSNSSALVNTSSGDALVTGVDSWAEVATPLSGSTPVGGPQVTVDFWVVARSTYRCHTRSALPFRAQMKF